MEEQKEFKGLDRSVRFQKIIDTAAELFHRKGYRSATLEGLARELGLSKAALYHYVSSKEQLLSIIYGQAFEKIFARIHEISAMAVEPDEKLRLILHDHIKNIIVKNLAHFSVFFAEENQLPRKDFQRIREEKKRYSRIVEDVIRDGIARGVFKPADPRLQTNAILGMCNWVYKWYRPDRESVSPDEIADYFAGLLESGYLVEKATEAHADPVVSEPSPKADVRTKTAETRKEVHRRIGLLCRELSDLVDQLDE